MNVESDTISRSARTGIVLAPVFLMLAPMLAFLRHHGASLSAPESVSFLMLGTGVGSILGCLSLLFGRSFLAIAAAGLVIASIDAQSDYFRAWNAELAWHFAAASVLALLLRNFLARSLPAIGAAVLIAAALGPSVPDVLRRDRGVGEVGASPPLVLHIVLDEHIGIEGIPREFDADGELEAELIKFYTSWGFRLHGRAFSRYFDTSAAISNLLNFHATLQPDAYFDEPFRRGASLNSNEYFETMHRRGHSIHVYQTDYIDLCDGAGAVTVAHCFEYLLETPTRLRDLPLGDDDKFAMLTAMYMRTSVIWKESRIRYRDFRRSREPSALPGWDRVRGRVSAVSGMVAFDALREDLRDPEPGGLYFAHLVLPHYPYSYDADCQLRSNPSSWLDAGVDGGGEAGRNDEGSRGERYAAYLEQLRCTTGRLGTLFEQLKESGHYDDARIIVHGDHGSRITFRNVRFRPGFLEDPHAASDLVDGFSTIFAFKGPGGKGGYERPIHAIDTLLDAYLETGHAPEADGSQQPPEALLVRDNGPHVPIPLPRFAHGQLEAIDGLQRISVEGRPAASVGGADN